MKFETHELFPTPLWAVDFAPEDVVSMNARLKAEIEGIISPRISLLDGRNYQTSHDLHKRPAFAELIALVEGALGKIMQSLKVDEYPIMITGCWANINPYGSSHLTHNHPNNYLSGIYYVDVPDIGSQIVFQDTRPGIIMPHSESGRYTANSAIAPVRAGLMIFFPSWLHHSVPINLGSTDRISIAFNFMFKDFAETISRPAWKPNAGDV